MLRRFGSARAALEALPRLARRSERARPVVAATRAAAEAELAALSRIGGRLYLYKITNGSPQYFTSYEQTGPMDVKEVPLGG